MKRIWAVILSVALIISMFPMKAVADSEPMGVGETLRFDFGGAEVEEGYIEYHRQMPILQRLDMDLKIPMQWRM